LPATCPCETVETVDRKTRCGPREALKAGAAIPAVPTGNNLPAATMPRHATAVAPSVTFREAARRYLESHANDWAPSERVRYARLLWVDWAPPTPKEGKEADPVARINLIADRPFRAIRPTDVRDVLTPIWRGPNHKPASLVRSLVERVLDAAAVEAGIDDYSNPAVWKGKLEHLLSGTSPEVEHFAAMDYKAVPAFLADAADLLLTFLVLTASRLSEATGADWSEIDGNVWTIPADRYKTGKEHKVPLSQAALASLGDGMPANVRCSVGLQRR
jgi:integrase